MNLQSSCGSFKFIFIIITKFLSKLVKPPAAAAIHSSTAKHNTINYPSGILDTRRQKPTTKNENTANSTTSEWDGWPNGMLECDFTWEEFEATGQLMSHWAAKVGGGDRRGETSAETWERGKRSTRVCLGIIECENADCDYAVRPFTTRTRINQQLMKICEICGASLIHQECEIRAKIGRAHV